MFIGVYLAIWGLTTILLLLNNPALRQRRYLAMSGILSGSLLVAFLVLSSWVGILTIGEPSSYSLPGDYLSRGPAGWLALSAGVLGLLSPFLAARLTK